MTRGLWGLRLSRLCLQCCLPLWCDARTMQLELCKKCSGKQWRSDYSSRATTLAVSDTGKRKAQRRNSESKVLLKCSFLNYNVFSLELGLKFKSPKTEAFYSEANCVATEALKTLFFFLFCFAELLQRLFSDESRTVSIFPNLFNIFISVPNRLITTRQLQNSSPCLYRKVDYVSAQLCGEHMTNCRIKTATRSNNKNVDWL